MQVRRIMCPIDFSLSSMAALDRAASLASQLEARLLIVHVDEHGLQSGAASFPSDIGRSTYPPRKRLEDATPAVPKASLERHFLQGKPADEIPKFARLHNVDLVIMGRQPASSRFHCRHDGVCASTSQRCHCPVMTINHDEAIAPWVS